MPELRKITGALRGALAAGMGEMPGRQGTLRDGAGAVPCRGLSQSLSPEQQQLVSAAGEAVRVAIYRKLPRVCGVCHLDREDVVQEAYLAACQAVRTWQAERGPYSRYAQTAALIHLDLLCRRASTRRRKPPAPADSLKRPRLVLADLEASSPPVTEAHLAELLGQLPERAAQAVRLHLAGHGREAIAERMGIRLSQVYNLMTQARDRLRAVLAA